MQMRTCPICKKEYSAPPALSRKDSKTEICPICSTKEALKAAGFNEEDSMYKSVVETVERAYKEKAQPESTHRITRQRLSPYEKTKAQVEATGNRWAIENFYATH
jgi:transcription elongation factor Elf1